MNRIEILIGLLLLLMVVPDSCRRLGRPALVYPGFVAFGLMLEPFAGNEVKTLFHEAGAVGFLLLLFQVGLEIDLPRPREIWAALRFAVPWALVQYPLLLVVAYFAELEMLPALVAATALTGSSVGMAYPAWQAYPGLSEAQRRGLLHVLVVLEAVAVVLLAVEGSALATGLSWWLLLRFIGMGAAVILVARLAPRMDGLFRVILTRATAWRTHLLVLLVLVVCAVGERLGLAAAKTAFVLGLFMSRAEHDGRGIEECIAPISQRLLIPVFFVSLGLRVEWSLVFSWVGLIAVGTAGLLLGAREVLHRRWLPVSGDRNAYLLLCPNLPIVALGASTLLQHGMTPESVGWLLMTGVCLTVATVWLLPLGARDRALDAPSAPGAA